MDDSARVSERSLSLLRVPLRVRYRAGCKSKFHQERQVAKNAAFNTNFDAIERNEPYKNNKSGHKGVYWCRSQGLWKAYINVQKRAIYLGGYHDIRDAIQAREEAEKEYFLPLIEAKKKMEVTR